MIDWNSTWWYNFSDMSRHCNRIVSTSFAFMDIPVLFCAAKETRLINLLVVTDKIQTCGKYSKC